MNIFLDPLFVDPANDDFHLTENSPCIDAGDPEFPLDPDGTYIEIGRYYFEQVSKIIKTQLALLYLDKKIDTQEALQKVDLQEIFGLSYDEFLNYANYEDELAINKGVDKQNLDTVFSNKEESNSKRSRTISQEVKDKVWNRDRGRCVQCASNEDLEFDHIIPWSKGGANTYRNIQLLCQHCNRTKSDDIGLDDS